MNRGARALASLALRHPSWLTRALRPPAAATATGLDPQLAALLAIQRRLGLPRLETLEVAPARRLSHQGLAPLDCEPYAMQQIVDVAGSPPLRLYRPHRRGTGLLVYFHGGGGVTGSVDSHDAWCRFLAFHAEVQVVSVEYRLAPEHPHPAAIADALAAWRWAVEHATRLGARKLAVGGDSFGGYLAAMIDQATSRPDHHPEGLPAAAGLPPPDLQVLIYPLTDLTMARPSHQRLAEGYLLTGPMMRWFRDHYLGTSAEEACRLASPLLLERIERAAPALVVLAGFDPLRDEGRAYARRLAEEAEAEVELQEHPDLIHGFVVMTGAIVRARAAGQLLGARLRERLA